MTNQVNLFDTKCYHKGTKLTNFKLTNCINLLKTKLHYFPEFRCAFYWPPFPKGFFLSFSANKFSFSHHFYVSVLGQIVVSFLLEGNSLNFVVILYVNAFWIISSRYIVISHLVLSKCHFPTRLIPHLCSGYISNFLIFYFQNFTLLFAPFQMKRLGICHNILSCSFKKITFIFARF